MELDEEASEFTPEYHKGEWCTLGGIFCQEGYCNECAIHWGFFERILSYGTVEKRNG
jgi:hypothetical protein